MAGAKIFLSCLVTLILFNFIFFLSGYNTELLSYDSIISVFITLGVIAVIVSALPIVDSESTMQWFISTVMMLSLFYSVTFQVFTYDLTLGFGLATRLTSMPMFSSDMTNIGFMPWIFFTVLGLLGTISGIFSTSGGA